jgi:hypothetical protein
MRNGLCKTAHGQSVAWQQSYWAPSYFFIDPQILAFERCVIVTRFRILIMGQCKPLNARPLLFSPTRSLRRTYVDFKTFEVVARQLRT